MLYWFFKFNLRKYIAFMNLWYFYNTSLEMTIYLISGRGDYKNFIGFKSHTSITTRLSYGGPPWSTAAFVGLLALFFLISKF